MRHSGAWSFGVTRILKIFTSSITAFSAAPLAARVASFLFFVASIADGTLMPFFPLWARNEAGIPIEYIGLLLGCYAGGELLATPFVGGIADRVGRRPVLLASTTGMGVGFVLLFLAPGWIATAFSLLVIGIFESVLHPTAAAVITDVVPADDRRGHFAMTRVMSSAGHIIGPALGGILALWSLHLIFFGAAVTILIGAAAVAALLPETWHRTSDQKDDDDEESITALGAALRDRRLAGLLVSISVLEIAASWIDAITPLYATAMGAITPTGIGMLFAYAGVIGVIFQWPVTNASQRFSGFTTVLLSGAIEALAFVFLLPAPALPLLIAAITFATFASMLSGPLVQAIVSELAPRNAQATYQAAFSVVFDMKDAVGPAIGTWLYAMSTVLPWGTGIVAAIVASGALAVTTRRHEAEQSKKAQNG
jgi:MFS transporter, DHA1 family, tetracycline resistance protein